MNAAGIIVEYNPFHNGHYYHIQETKKLTGADLIVAVMSGNFLQRGEPALVSKWARTKMALLGGADIVIELPYVFATQKAQNFAGGAVSLLDALNVTSICFGSENGEIKPFYETLNVMSNNETEFNFFLKDSLKKGKSYPRATADAFLSLKGNDISIDLSQPNNILGFHYIQAIENIKSTIMPYTIKRKTAHYHDQEFHNQTIASATSVRNKLFSGNKDDITAIHHVIPKTTDQQLIEYKNRYGTFHNWENYFPFFKYRLLSMTPNDLRLIYEVEEGIENRIVQNISSSHTFKEFMEKIKTKRYTWTRLQRICLHILTNSTKQEMKSNKPSYIRLLGTTTIGQKYLNIHKKNLSLPLVSKLASFSDDQMMVDIKASRIYAACLKEPYRSIMIKEEYSTPPVRYDAENQQFI